MDAGSLKRLRSSTGRHTATRTSRSRRVRSGAHLRGHRLGGVAWTPRRAGTRCGSRRRGSRRRTQRVIAHDPVAVEVRPVAAADVPDAPPGGYRSTTAWSWETVPSHGSATSFDGRDCRWRRGRLPAPRSTIQTGRRPRGTPSGCPPPGRERRAERAAPLSGASRGEGVEPGREPVPASPRSVDPRPFRRGSRIAMIAACGRTRATRPDRRRPTRFRVRHQPTEHQEEDRC